MANLVCIVKFQEGTWIWQHSGTAIDYANWDNTQPDNYLEEEHYSYILKNSGKWNDIKNNWDSAPICQILMSSISEKMATDFAIVNSKLEILEEVNHGVIGNLVRASILLH